MIISVDGKAKFGYLTPIKFVGRNKYSKKLWLCQCDCGNEKIVIEGELTRKDSKRTVSCGCYFKKTHTKHNMHSTATYQCWADMKSRCNNPKLPSYINYGGRGITYCDRWENFITFFEDMGEKPDNLTLERIDNEKGYCKENCTWATRADQNRNTRRQYKLSSEGGPLP